MIRLPVSGIEILLRQPDGADDIALIEGDSTAIPAALRLLARLATRADGAALDCAMLPVTDFEILLLRLRETLLGAEIGSDVRCPQCSERVAISFRIAAYLAGIGAGPPRDTPPPDAEGWLGAGDGRYRLPRVADLLAVAHAAHPGGGVARAVYAGSQRPVARPPERLVARIAPEVSGPVGGACPGCAAPLSVLFDVKSYVMTELRRLAAGVYAEVHALASAYGWAEAAILALPGARRRRYAELARDAKVPALA